MKPGHAHRFRHVAVLALLFLSGASSARANIAETPGDFVAEPLPLLGNAHIVHEDLLIDMRPVASGKPARIVARYALRNDGLRGPLSLFLIGRGDRQGSVRIDGHVVPARAVQAEVATALPRGLAGASAPVGPKAGLAFEINLEPGVQTLEVEYLTQPDINHLDLVDRYVIDYVLSPARRWASYGTLTLRVQVPQDWDMHGVPASLSSADSVSGRSDGDRTWKFREIPSGTIRFQISPARAPYIALVGAQGVTCLLTLLVPILAAFRLRRRAQEETGPVTTRERLLSFVLCLWAVAGLPLFTVPIDLYWLKHRAPSHYHMLATVAAWAVGTILCLLGHAFAGWNPKHVGEKTAAR